MNVNDLFGKFSDEKKKDVDITNHDTFNKVEKRTTQEFLQSGLSNKKQKKDAAGMNLETEQRSMIDNKVDPVRGFQSLFENSKFRITEKMKDEAVQFCEKQPPKSGGNDFVDYKTFDKWCSELNSHLWNTYVSNMRAHMVLKNLTVDSKNNNLSSSLKKKREEFLMKDLLPNEELLYNLISKVDNIKNFEAVFTTNEKDDSNLVLFYQNLLNPEEKDTSLENKLRYSLFDLLVAIFEEHENTDIKYLILQKLHLMVNDLQNQEDNQLKDWQLLIFEKFFALKIPQIVNNAYEQLRTSTERMAEGIKNEIDDFKILIAEFYTSLLNILESNKKQDSEFVGTSIHDIIVQINFMNDWFLKLQVFIFEKNEETGGDDDTYIWYEYFDLLFAKIDALNDENLIIKLFDNLNEKIDKFDSFLEFLVVKFSKFKNPKKIKKFVNKTGNLEELENFQILMSLIFRLIDNYTFLKFEFVDKLQGLQLIMIFFRNYFNKDNFKYIIEDTAESIEPLKEFDSMEWQKCLQFILPLLFQILCIILSRDTVNVEPRKRNILKQDLEKLDEESLRILEYCTLLVQCGLLKYLFKPLNDIIIVHDNEEEEDIDDKGLAKEILCTALFPLSYIFTKSLDSTKRFDILQFYKYWISIVVSLLNNLQFDSEERGRLRRKLFELDEKLKAVSYISHYDKLLMIKTFISNRIAKKYRSKCSKNLDDEIKPDTDMQNYVVSEGYLFKIDYGFDIIKLIAIIQSWYLVDCDVSDENSQEMHLRLLELKQFKAELLVSDSGNTYLDVIDSFLGW